MNSRTKSMLLAVMSAAPLFGCAAAEPSGLSSLGSQPYFLGAVPRPVDRDYLYRYACADGEPVVCRCDSLLGRTCDCQCTP
jgi:hypothetical protein